MKRLVIFMAAMCGLLTGAAAQTGILIKHANRDTAYIKDYYRKYFIVRAYESTKFNNFKYINGHDKLIYKPNDHNNFGLGFNYRFLCLNLGVYVPGAGKDKSTYGKTHYLDLQTHLYVHKFILDFYGQFYRGYYLANSESVISNLTTHIITRPDVSTRDITLELQYVFNDKRFSYNAPFYQNELQKQSAGSFLLGGGIYHFDARGDSALTPSDVSYANFFHNYRFNASSNSGMGASGGYAYTLVIKKRFFITGILTGGLGVNEASLSNTLADQQQKKLGAVLNLSGKFAAGYNSDKYFAGVTYIRLVTEDNAVEPGAWQEVNTGNFRFTVAKRFRLKRNILPKSELIKIE